MCNWSTTQKDILSPTKYIVAQRPVILLRSQHWLEWIGSQPHAKWSSRTSEGGWGGCMKNHRLLCLRFRGNRKANHYKMFVIHRDKSIGSTLKAEVVYRKKTSPTSKLSSCIVNKEGKARWVEQIRTLDSFLLPTLGGRVLQSCCGLSSFILFSGKLYLHLFNTNTWSSSYYSLPSKYLSEIQSIYLNQL